MFQNYLTSELYGGPDRQMFQLWISLLIREGINWFENYISKGGFCGSTVKREKEEISERRMLEGNRIHLNRIEREADRQTDR